MQELIKRVRSQSDRRTYGTELVSVLDGDGVIQYISDEHAEALGWSPEHLIGQCVFSFVHPDDLQLAQRLFQEMKVHHKIVVAEIRILHKSGQWVDVRAEGAPIFENGQLMGYMSVSNTRIRIDMDELCANVEVDAITHALATRKELIQLLS